MRQAKRDTLWKEIETEGKWKKKNMKQTGSTGKKREIITKRKNKEIHKREKEKKKTNKRRANKKKLNKNEQKMMKKKKINGGQKKRTKEDKTRG